MKASKLNFKLLASSLVLATVLYNCSTKSVDSLTSFTYTFEGFDEKLPVITPAPLTPINIKEGTFTSSVATAAVSDALTTISSAGAPIPATVQKAVSDVNQALSNEQADKLISRFTPSVLANLAQNGSLPADLQKEVAAIASNHALEVYLPTSTLPEIETTYTSSAGGRVGAPKPSTPPVPVAKANDACFNAANQAYQRALTNYTTSRDTQLQYFNNQYTQRVTTINSDLSQCTTSRQRAYERDLAAVQKTYDNNMASLAALRRFLPVAIYNSLQALYLLNYTQSVTELNNVRTAALQACQRRNDLALQQAQELRDRNAQLINAAYERSVASIVAARERAYASCHNQGRGR